MILYIIRQVKGLSRGQSPACRPIYIYFIIYMYYNMILYMLCGR